MKIRALHLVIFAALFIIATFFVDALFLKDAKIKNTVSNLNGKTVLFPRYCTQNKSVDSLMHSNFKILTTFDSLGCFTCKLQLDKWKQYIQELHNNNIDVNVLFFFNASDSSLIDVYFQNEDFNYPYILDTRDSLNILNKLPRDFKMQTYLLDKTNKIIAIGNPITNPSIKGIFKKQFTGKDIDITKNTKTIIYEYNDI